MLKYFIIKYKGVRLMKSYQTPEIEIVSFSKTDVMLSSGNRGYQSDPFTDNPFEGGNQ